MGKTKAIIASYVGVLLYAGLVFLGAWKIAYWQGLLYVVLALVGTTLSHVLVPAGSTTSSVAGTLFPSPSRVTCARAAAMCRDAAIADSARSCST
jgi:hypothetical protein